MSAINPTGIYSVVITYFREDSSVVPTHTLVPLEQWSSIQSVVGAAVRMFDANDTKTAIDSRLKSLRKAVEKYRE